MEELRNAYVRLDLDARQISDDAGEASEIACMVLAYFTYRAEVLNTFVEPRLMDGARAQREYTRLRKRLHSKCPVPMNKQKGTKKAPACLTGMVNMIIDITPQVRPATITRACSRRSREIGGRFALSPAGWVGPSRA